MSSMQKRGRGQIKRSPATSFLGMGVIVASVVCFLALLSLVIVFVRLVLG